MPRPLQVSAKRSPAWTRRAVHASPLRSFLRNEANLGQRLGEILRNEPGVWRKRVKVR